jgi:pimeloyl-ACP methyl ester carboxylesterase
MAKNREMSRVQVDRLQKQAERLQKLAVSAATWLSRRAQGGLNRLMREEMPPAIEARQKSFALGEAGYIKYYVDRSGHGPPVVLLHSVNAAASSYEVRPLFEALRGERIVYAVDLPGFGGSLRDGAEFTVEFYRHALAKFLRHVSRRERSAVDVVAMSLSAEFAAAVAVQEPELVASLVLLSPTGFDEPGQPASPRLLRMVAQRLRPDAPWAELARTALYLLLVSKPSLRYFLDKERMKKGDERLVQYAHVTSHQPQAWNAPWVFLTGDLFTANAIDEIYAPVTAPVLVLHGRDRFARFDMLPVFADQHDNWRVERVRRAGALVQFDQPEATVEAMTRFWEELDASHARVAGGRRELEHDASEGHRLEH